VAASLIKLGMRGSVSGFPFFSTSSIGKTTKKGTGSVYLLPSYAPFGALNQHWTHQLGFSVNLLGSPYGGINSSIVQAGGVGCDILSDPQKHTGWGSPVFYVSGTININSIISQKGNVQAK
jgi:hypothetical protein